MIKQYSSFFTLFVFPFVLSISLCHAAIESPQQQDKHELQHILNNFIAARADIKQELKISPGYAIINWNHENTEHTNGWLISFSENIYHRIRISQFDLGQRWRKHSFKAIIIFKDLNYLNKFKSPHFRFSASIIADNKNSSTEILNPDFKIYLLTENTTIESATARTIKISNP